MSTKIQYHVNSPANPDVCAKYVWGILVKKNYEVRDESVDIIELLKVEKKSLNPILGILT